MAKQTPKPKSGSPVPKTTAVFFPFDLFGSAGTAAGAELLADEFEEVLADNRREQVATRADAYTEHVEVQRFSFETLAALENWRADGRQVVRQAWRDGSLLLWIAGNHLGVLPVYDTLAGTATLVVQLDAHLDIHHFADCTKELSHGNFLLHCDGVLPPLLNLGHRELLLRPDYVSRYYRHALSAAELATDVNAGLERVRKMCAEAEKIFVDIDLDVFDAAYFPAVAQPSPFGVDPPLVLRLLQAVWSEKVIGVALSEFDPARDQNDRSLALATWLIEYVLLLRHEKREPRGSATGA